MEGIWLRRYTSNDEKELCREYNIRNYELYKLEKGIYLKPKSKTIKELRLFYENEYDQMKWLLRIQRTISYIKTSGIGLRTALLPSKSFRLTAWDFSGDPKDYIFQSYFISTRTIFLIVWDLSKEEEGIEGVRFWCKSLSCLLPKNSIDSNGRPLFSILVVGTFLDRQSVKKTNQARDARREKIIQIGIESGLDCVLQYFEVSCLTLESIEELKEALLATSLFQSYQTSPKFYPLLERAVEKLQQEHSEFPIIETSQLISECKVLNPNFNCDPKLLKFGLRKLHEAGKCFHFERPKALSNHLFLNLHFLANEIFAPLITATLNKQNRVIENPDFYSIWPEMYEVAPSITNLMEKFEFAMQILDGDENWHNDFLHKQTVIPHFLPKFIPEEGHKLREYWIEDPPPTQFLQETKNFSFSILPLGFFSRLLVLLSKFVYKKLIWEDQVLLNKNGCLGLMKVNESDCIIHVQIRGENENLIKELENIIFQNIQTCLGSYLGVNLL